MLITVAAETGQDVFALVARPFWQILYQFHLLMERAQRVALRGRVERVDDGLMAALAFNKPEALDEELQKAHAALDAFEDGPADSPDQIAALRAAGESLAARIEHGRVLAPEALVADITPSEALV